MDALGVHDGRDGEHDGGREHALDGARQDLGHGDQPHRARRLDAVLDLPGVAELLRQRHGHGLDALEHDRDADDAGDEDRGERRLADPAAATPDALADGREHVQEHEDQQERLDQRPGDELPLVLPQHDEVALEEADAGRTAGRLRRGPGLGDDMPVGAPARPVWTE